MPTSSTTESSFGLLNWIVENKTWIFSGVGVTAIVSIFGLLWHRRERDAGQTQLVKDQSVAVQAGRDIVAQEVKIGPSYEDVRQIAESVFEGNFYRLQGVAQDTAKRRADELLEDYLQKLSERNPAALTTAEDPDMQYAVFVAQKEYARSGDKNLENVLVDVLVDRAGQAKRSLMQIVLNESLNVAPKLTPEQFNTLSLIFVIRYTRFLRIVNLEDFHRYLKDTFVPLIEGLRKDDPLYQHLEYAGCGTQQITAVSIAKVFRQNYSAIFWKGITKQQMEDLIKSKTAFTELIMPCLHDNNLYQFTAMNEDALRNLCEKNGWPNDKTAELVKTQNANLMNDEEIHAYMTSICPELDTLLNVWQNSPMRRFTLTSVGIAIAHANLRRKTGQEYDLSIWIN